MAAEPILDFEFDGDNLEKLSRRGIFPEDLYDVLEKPHYFGRNRGDRRGTHLLIGRNSNNRCIAISPAARSGAWSLATGDGLGL